MQNQESSNLISIKAKRSNAYENDKVAMPSLESITTPKNDQTDESKAKQKDFTNIAQLQSNQNSNRLVKVRLDNMRSEVASQHTKKRKDIQRGQSSNKNSVYMNSGDQTQITFNYQGNNSQQPQIVQVKGYKQSNHSNHKRGKSYYTAQNSNIFPGLDEIQEMPNNFDYLNSVRASKDRLNNIDYEELQRYI
eukprot:403345035